MTYKSNLKLPNMPWRIQIISLFMKSIKRNTNQPRKPVKFTNVLKNFKNFSVILLKCSIL